MSSSLVVFKSKKDAVSKLGELSILVAKLYKVQGSERQFEIWDPLQFAAYCERVCYGCTNLRYHEIFSGFPSRVHLFLDIEWHHPTSIADFETNYVFPVIEEIKTRLGKPIEWEWWDAHRLPSKASCHVYFPNVIFPSLKHLAAFMKDVQETTRIPADILDLNVYSHGSLRMPGMTNQEYRYPLRPRGIPPQQLRPFYIDKFKRSFIRYIPGMSSNTLDLVFYDAPLTLPPLTRYVSSSSSVNEETSCSTFLTSEEKDRVREYLTTVYKVDRIEERDKHKNSLNWRLERVYCPFIGKKHDANATYLNIDNQLDSSLCCTRCEKKYPLDVPVWFIIGRRFSPFTEQDVHLLSG